MSTENELQHLKTQIQNLKAEVTKWSQYCAYVAGTSIGIILFILLFAAPEEPTCPECDVCPEPVVCPECDVCPEPVACPEPVECPTPKANQNSSASVPKSVDPDTFPRTYIIQPGDNFSKITQAVYGRASWAKWLAEQNGIDPSKLQIGQEITLPKPKE